MILSRPTLKVVFALLACGCTPAREPVATSGESPAAPSSWAPTTPSPPVEPDVVGSDASVDAGADATAPPALPVAFEGAIEGGCTDVSPSMKKRREELPAYLLPQHDAYVARVRLRDFPGGRKLTAKQLREADLHVCLMDQDLIPVGLRWFGGSYSEEDADGQDRGTTFPDEILVTLAKDRETRFLRWKSEPVSGRPRTERITEITACTLGAVRAKRIRGAGCVDLTRQFAERGVALVREARDAPGPARIGDFLALTAAAFSRGPRASVIADPSAIQPGTADAPLPTLTSSGARATLSAVMGYAGMRFVVLELETDGSGFSVVIEDVTPVEGR